MLTFIALAVLLILLSTVVLIVPLLRGTRADTGHRTAQNVEFARERLAEIDHLFEQGEISKEDFESLKFEIESNLVGDLKLSDEPQATGSNINRGASNAVAVTLICCLLPIAAVLVYLVTGEPDAVVRENANNLALQQDQSSDINELVQGLEQRLQQDPNDIQGWTILARTYRQLGQNAQAVGAYRKLQELQPKNADVLAGLADAIAATQDGRLNQEANLFIEQALQSDPEHPQSLWLAGLGHLQAGNNVDAIENWQTLSALMEGFPEQQAELQRVINETAEAANITLPEDDGGTSSPAASTGLSIAVKLDPELAQSVSPSDTVFVLARAKNGPPAPLAVKRLQVRDLPASLTLTTADAMMPQLTIETFPELLVLARISRSGQPIAQAGDYESEVIETGNTNPNLIQLTVGDRVQ